MTIIFFYKKEAWLESLILVMILRIAKQAGVRKECLDLKIENVWENWDACLKMRAFNKKINICWYPPPIGILKFNVDGATWGKSGLAGVGGVLRNHEGRAVYMFSKYVGIKNSNEAKVMSIMEALRILCNSFSEQYYHGK